MAGYKSASWNTWNTLFKDYTLVAQKLEQLGFTYSNGKVIVIEPLEEQKYV